MMQYCASIRLIHEFGKRVSGDSKENGRRCRESGHVVCYLKGCDGVKRPSDQLARITRGRWRGRPFVFYGLSRLGSIRRQIIRGDEKIDRSKRKTV